MGGHGRRNGGLRGHSVGVDRRPAEVVGVVADLVGDNGNRVGAVCFAAKGLNLRQGRVRGQARGLSWQHGGFPRFPLGLLLDERLLFPAHLAAGRTPAGATRFCGTLLKCRSTSQRLSHMHSAGWVFVHVSGS